MICIMCETEYERWKEDENLLCKECEEIRQKEIKQIEEIQKKGHPFHCACRQVWGDGECECDLYKKGYDPYKWMNKKSNQSFDAKDKSVIKPVKKLS